MECTQPQGTQSQSTTYGLLHKPQVFFLLGGPGSGKGTQAQNLIRDYKFKHLSTGDLLRQEKEKKGQYCQIIEKQMKEGKLLPSELVVKLLKKGISTYGNRRYLFDGFPRNKQNLEEFQRQLADLVVVKNLIFLDCPHQVMISRITERGKTSGRSDDNPDSIKLRLQTFEQETVPIVQQFQANKNCIHIDATKQKEQVYQQIRQKLTEENIYPPPPAQMIFVLGGPGSGKGTQCAILVKKYGFIHLSTGDLLRQQVKSGSSLGKQLSAIMKQGKLISSELMVKIIQQQIERNNYGGRYLLDGFPRGQENMDAWQKVMAKWVNLKSVIYFECKQQELKRRIIERGKTSGRADDVQSVIDKRLQTFYQQNSPVVAFYQKMGKLHSFNAMRPIEKITADLQAHLEDIGVFPKDAKQHRPKAIILLGNSGSGKTTQSKRIATQFGFTCISTGDLLRQQINNNGRHAELFSQTVKKGKLVRSDLVVKLMKQIVQKQHWKGVFVLDGFPRNKQNLRWWSLQLGVEINLDCMLVLQCDQKISTERVIKRNDNRLDDTLEVVQKKNQTYRNETFPLIRYYISHYEHFTSQIDANQNEQEVFLQIKKTLLERGYKHQ